MAFFRHSHHTHKHTQFLNTVSNYRHTQSQFVEGFFLAAPAPAEGAVMLEGKARFLPAPPTCDVAVGPTPCESSTADVAVYRVRGFDEAAV